MKRRRAEPRAKTLRSLLKPSAATLEADVGMLMHRRERLQTELLNIKQRSCEVVNTIERLSSEIALLRSQALVMEKDALHTYRSRASESGNSSETTKPGAAVEEQRDSAKYTTLTLDY